jgi:hypothetical protein
MEQERSHPVGGPHPPERRVQAEEVKSKRMPDEKSEGAIVLMMSETT